jgi:hypothetical protein
MEVSAVLNASSATSDCFQSRNRRPLPLFARVIATSSPWRILRFWSYSIVIIRRLVPRWNWKERFRKGEDKNEIKAFIPWVILSLLARARSILTL